MIEKKFKWKTVASAVVVLICALTVSFFGLVYFVSPDEDSLLGKLVGRYSYPAVVIDKKNVVYSSMLRDNLVAIEKFYESQDFSKIGMRVDFSTEDGKKRLKVKEKEILNKAIEDKAIEVLAKKRDIFLTKQEVDKIVSEKLEEYGTRDEANSNLKKIYGWDLEQFKSKIVMPSLYSAKLSEEISKELAAETDARNQIEKAKAELEIGKDFAEVARSYSQGASAQNGGDFGWIAKDHLLPEISEKIFEPSLAGINNTEIIESQLGFHIVRVEENKKENGVDMVRIKQIFSRKKTFGDWIGEQLKDMNVNMLLRDYYWDEQGAVAEFRSLEMRDFEKNVYENSEGDISVMF